MTTFTRTSPTGGAVSPGVTEVGGLVLDLIGLNGVRVISQLAASSLYIGFFDSGTPNSYQGQPGTIGVQEGLTPAVLAALGGGLASVAVRVTLYDGDTAPGDFDYLNQNTLLLNGVSLGDFSAVATQQTSSDGLTLQSSTSGFGDEILSTGWFSTTNAATLAALFASLSAGTVTYQLSDIDPYDNYFDFRQGVDGGLINVGQAPNISPVAGNDTASTTLNTAVVIDVTANDFDTDGSIVSYTLGAAPAHGQFILNTTTNKITYTPTAGFTGTDTFTYTVTDNLGATDTATVTVNVSGPPVNPGTGTFIRLDDSNNVFDFQTRTSGVQVQALGGDDSITGSAFNDSLNGGTGTDLLRGGGGNDTITGGAGFDRVQGGTGNDTFVFNRGDLVNPVDFGGNMDHIIDFHGAGGYSPVENDIIRLTGFGAGSLVFEKLLGNDPAKQIYKIFDDSGIYQGSLYVQMADGNAQLTAGDFYFN